MICRNSRTIRSKILLVYFNKKSMLPKLIEDRLKRINIKSKRRRILLKKAMELKYLCDLDMLFIIKDAEFNKYTIYNSSDDTFDPNLVGQLTQ